MLLRVLDEVTWDGKPVPGERTHALFRALVEAGARGLSEGALVEEIWADERPANPTKALQVVVSRARSATRPDAIERTERGYRIGLSPKEVDAWALRPDGLRLAEEGRYAEALPLLERAISDGAAPDEILAALLRAEAAERGVPAALERYEAYREELADRLGIDPSPGLRALHVELLARDRPVRTGVHYDSDDLIGRDADAAAVNALVRTHRVVSIVGAGGLGKTRLAHLVGRTAEQPVVHFVELAGVRSPDGVAVEVADRLGVRESLTSSRNLKPRHTDLHSRIVEVIGVAPTLLILDNCEHVVGAVADLVSLLIARTPALTILTTSRAPLGLSGERVYLLPELSPADGVALFRERAVAARPDVTLDEAQVGELVARLDGLPLAIELAAARVRAMSVAEILRRLDNRFTLLRGGSRDAPERHQTLLAVIDWSWNLLSEAERAALRRFAVFRDGFALEGASAVLEYDALDVLQALVDQSLVVVGEGDAGEVRYRLLETVREFGRMQLVDSGDDTAAEKLLRDWAVRFAAGEAERCYTAEQVEAVRSLRSEEGNLVDLLRRCLDERDATVVAPVFGALAGMWTIEGSHLKVVNIGDAVEDVLLSAPTPADLADAVRMSLVVSITNATILRGLDAEGALERLRELGPGQTPWLRANVRALLAAAVPGIMQDVSPLAALADDPDPSTAIVASMWTAQVQENSGDLAGAQESARYALSLCRDEDGPWLRAALSAQLATFALHSGDFDQAQRFAQNAMPGLLAVGAMEDYTQARTVLAIVAVQRGVLDDAQALIEELAREESAQSVFGGALAIACCRAEILLARGEIEDGLRAYAEAVEDMRSRPMMAHQPVPDFEPWVLFPQAAAVAAALRHGRPGVARASRDELAARLPALLTADGFVDIPIAGAILFALGAWECVEGDSGLGARLLGFADRFSFSRMLPSLDWAWATSLVDPVHPEPRPPLELTADVLKLLSPRG
ncbi:MAG: BTAD domain-containing putative transcriptional regulator [Nocardioidaceae bacterium]